VTVDDLRWIPLQDGNVVASGGGSDGAILGGATPEEMRPVVFALNGLAFQVADDILDVTRRRKTWARRQGRMRNGQDHVPEIVGLGWVIRKPNDW
jgi:geranylgeranyl pyrophosphate synthase